MDSRSGRITCECKLNLILDIYLLSAAHTKEDCRGIIVSAVESAVPWYAGGASLATTRESERTRTYSLD